MSADDQAGAELAQHTRLAGRAGHEITVNGGCAPDRVGLVERERVYLDDRRVAFERGVGDFAFDGEVEQPPRRRGPDADARFRPFRENGVDHLDAA